MVDVSSLPYLPTVLDGQSSLSSFTQNLSLEIWDNFNYTEHFHNHYLKVICGYVECF